MPHVLRKHERFISTIISKDILALKPLITQMKLQKVPNIRVFIHTYRDYHDAMEDWRRENNPVNRHMRKIEEEKRQFYASISGNQQPAAKELVDAEAQATVSFVSKGAMARASKAHAETQMSKLKTPTTIEGGTQVSKMKSMASFGTSPVKFVASATAAKISFGPTRQQPEEE